MIIFTDGSALRSGGPGGISAVILNRELEVQFVVSFPLKSTTSPRAELMAAFLALHLCEDHQEATVYSDSYYVTKGITCWLRNWKLREYRNSKGKEIAHRDLWEAIDRLLWRRPVTFRRVRGHQGNPGNELADYAAREAALSLSEEGRNHG
jgi:ribonuclease HI